MEIILFGIFVGVVAYILIYNKLVSSRQKVRESWADVDVQLKRRRDLIPNLVNTVKGYATHEKKLLEKITKERAEAMTLPTDDLKKLGALEGSLAEDVGAILIVAEAYPDLKANQNFLKLQNELSETEDQIASSRRIYNANVTSYNTLLQIFPVNILAQTAGFQECNLLEFKDVKNVPSAKMD